MFDDYAKKLEDLAENVPTIFKSVARKGALNYVKEAVKETDRQGLVDTGNYKRSWWAEPSQNENSTVIVMGNTAEYASHLEYGHKTRNGGKTKGHFVGKMALNDTEAFCVLDLRKEIDIAMLAKKHGVSKNEIKKYFK